MARQEFRGRDAKRIRTLNARTAIRWAGHLIKMPGERLSKNDFYGALQQSHEAKCYKDTIKMCQQGLGFELKDD